MADGTVGVFDESGAGTDKIDTTELTVSGQTVNRERVVLAGEAPDEIARVHDGAPGSSDMGLVVRPIVTAGMEADGHSATLGTTTDAAVTSGIAGTISAKLRGFLTILSDVWDDVGNRLRVDTGLTQPLTDTQLRATAVPVGDGGGSLTVDGAVSLAAAIPAGTNNIGDVDVLSLPALPAGTNNIGDVDVLTLPALTAGENFVGHVGGQLVRVGEERTRPADTTQYAAGDAVVSSMFVFSGAARINNGQGLIRQARVRVTSAQTVPPLLELWVFRASGITVTDNSGFAPSDANTADELVGVITLPNIYQTTLQNICISDDLLLPFVAGSGGTSIWGVLVVRNAYIPTSAEGFDVRLVIDQY
jgi:hypothetical protein